MAYLGIDKKRFLDLLKLGTSDDERRRFFHDARLHLIQRGARVQNPPHGEEPRLRMLVHGLPEPTERVVQRWFASQLAMIDPMPVDEILTTMSLHDEHQEPIAEGEARRLARSCLVHLFSESPPSTFIDYLRKSANVQVATPEVDLPKTADGPLAKPSPTLSPELRTALIQILEGQDPDEALSALAPEAASFLAGLHAARNGNEIEVETALSALMGDLDAYAQLQDFSDRCLAKPVLSHTAESGLTQIGVLEPDADFEYSMERDEMIGVCTKDYPENSVFVHPIAIRTTAGKYVSLARKEDCERIFPESGDVIVFTNRASRTRLQRGEIGIWTVEPNALTQSGHRTRFHVASEKKKVVYEVRNVPYVSTDYDSVREYIKEQVAATPQIHQKSLLFLLRDHLIVGAPSGKDLAKDDGFDNGLNAWRQLDAIAFEGRLIVPGPLPLPKKYECEALAASLKKLFATDPTDPDRLSKAQQRRLQERISSGEARLTLARAERLREELSLISEHDGALSTLVKQAMSDDVVRAEVKERIQQQVNEQVAQNAVLRQEREQIEKKLAELAEKLRAQEKEQKALAPGVAKAIRAAFDKARSDAIGTLGQVAVFQSLMTHIGEPVERPAASAWDNSPHTPVSPKARSLIPNTLSLTQVLRSIGIPLQTAQAIAVAGNLAMDASLIVVLDGVCARLAAEGWGSCAGGGGEILECEIGMTSDQPVTQILGKAPQTIVVLDANLSPIEIYGRQLLDIVQRNILNAESRQSPRKLILSYVNSVAGLPLPPAINAVSVRISLDRNLPSNPVGDILSWLDSDSSFEERPQCISRLWRPAANRLIDVLRKAPEPDAAMAVSVFSLEDDSSSP